METTEVLAALDQVKADIDSLMRNLGGEGNSNTAAWLAKIIKASMDHNGMVTITPELLDILKTSGCSLRKDKQSVILQYYPGINFKISGWPKALIDAQLAVSLPDLARMLQPSVKEKRFTRADVTSAFKGMGVAI